MTDEIKIRGPPTCPCVHQDRRIVSRRADNASAIKTRSAVSSSTGMNTVLAAGRSVPQLVRCSCISSPGLFCDIANKQQGNANIFLPKTTPLATPNLNRLVQTLLCCYLYCSTLAVSTALKNCDFSPCSPFVEFSKKKILQGNFSLTAPWASLDTTKGRDGRRAKWGELRSGRQNFD